MLPAAPAEPPFSPRSSVGPHRAADYFALPDEPRCELLFGELLVTPAPSLPHQVVVGELYRRLADVARETAGLAVLSPFDLQLFEHTVVQPDVLYYGPGWHRQAVGLDRERRPQLVVEVLSPGSVRRDRGAKLKAYQEAAIPEYWIVDPAHRQIEFLELRDGAYVVRLAIDDRYVSSILDGLSLDLPALWAELERVAALLAE